MTAVGCPLPWIPVAVARSVDSRPGRCGPVLSLVSRPPTCAHLPELSASCSSGWSAARGTVPTAAPRCGTRPAPCARLGRGRSRADAQLTNDATLRQGPYARSGTSPGTGGPFGAALADGTRSGLPSIDEFSVRYG